MLKFERDAVSRLDIGDVPLAIGCDVDALLPIFRKVILPFAMPWRFRLPSRIAGSCPFMPPMPNAMAATLSDRWIAAHAAGTGNIRRRFAGFTFDKGKPHDRSMSAFVLGKRNAEAMFQGELFHHGVKRLRDGQR